MARGHVYNSFLLSRLQIYSATINPTPVEGLKNMIMETRKDGADMDVL